MHRLLITAFVVFGVAPAFADDTHSGHLRQDARARWQFSGDVDLDTLLQHGIAFSLGVTPPRLPRWRFGIGMRSHDLPEFQTGLSSNNDALYVTTPVAVEVLAQYTTRRRIVLGARAGVVHLHFARIGTFGIDEEFDWGVTPFVGFEWKPIDHIYVQPWLGVMVTAYRQTHGELPMQEADRTYSTWPSMLRGGISVGARY